MVNIVQDFVCFELVVSSLDIDGDPGYKVVLEGTFNQLVKEIGR